VARAKGRELGGEFARRRVAIENDRNRALLRKLADDRGADAGAAARDDDDPVSKMEIHGGWGREGPGLARRQPRKAYRSSDAGFISIE
jgi:hypothetical protein